MSRHDAVTNDLLDRYLTGSATAEEIVRVEEYLAMAPLDDSFVRSMQLAQSSAMRADVPPLAHGHAIAARRLGFTPAVVTREMRDMPAPHPQVSMSSAEGDVVMTRSHRASTASGRRAFAGVMPLGMRSLRHRVGYLFAGAAAVIIIMFGYAHFPIRASAHLPGTTYTTANAQRANIMLPDGSRVTLDVASRLDVPRDYAMGNRTVTLTGEALFTVLNHTNQPFRVITGKTTAEVLGTSFIVRRYTADTITNIAVRDGKVSVHHGATPSIVLTAMQQADVGRSPDVRVSAVDPSRFSFVNGVLSFKNTPLHEVAVELGRWYDVEIRLGDASLAGTRVTGEFLAGSRADLRELLAEPLGVRVVQDGRIFTIYRR
jgi:ferric-dicitrate binding protein FerR (iron transport regulator)